MRISARCDYACRALLELALHWPGKKPMQIQTISERRDIPMRYLVQILIQLKRAGLIASIRGKGGGYNLIRPPGRISLGEVMRLMGGPLLPVAGGGKKTSVFTGIWKEAEAAMADVLDRVSFEDIAGKVKGIKGTIVYQI
jgi:Rrf2 family protein